VELKPTAAEEKLLQHASAGTQAPYATGQPEKDDPAKGAAWKADRTIRAEVIYALATGSPPTGSNAAWPVHVRGIRIDGAKITGQLDFTAAQIKFPFELTGCHLEERLILSGASVPSIDLSRSHLPKGIEADNLIVHGNFFMAKSVVAGGATLQMAKIDGQLNCNGGKFLNKGGDALKADRMTVGGEVFLDQNFAADGEVRLLGAKIDGQLNCNGGNFANPGGDALAADGITVGGSAFLSQPVDNTGTLVGQGFTAKGEVRLVGAKIEGTLSCRGATFDSGEKTLGEALTLEATTIGGGLFLDLLAAKPRGTVNLGHAKAVRLVDDEKSRPDSGKLVLDGFQYESIAGRSPRDAISRLKWIRLQADAGFSFQPYEQLAAVLRRTGDEAGARKVLFEKQKTLYEKGKLSRVGKIANWFLYLTVGYGYYTWAATLWAAAIVAFGAGVFDLAARASFLARPRDPAKVESRPPPVNPKVPKAQECNGYDAALYSLGVFLPTVKVEEVSNCALRDEAQVNRGLRFYGFRLWYLAEGISGWVLAILFTGALSGLIRKE